METRGRNVSWQELVDVIKAAGAWTNPDCGNFPDEEARQAGLRVMYPMSSGSSHVHYDPQPLEPAGCDREFQKEVGYKGIDRDRGQRE